MRFLLGLMAVGAVCEARGWRAKEMVKRETQATYEAHVIQQPVCLLRFLVTVFG